MITQHKRLKHPPFIDLTYPAKDTLKVTVGDKVMCGEWISDLRYAPLSGKVLEINHEMRYIRIENDRQDTLSDDFLSLNTKERVRRYFSPTEPYERFSVESSIPITLFTYLSNEPFISLDDQSMHEIKLAFKRLIQTILNVFKVPYVTLVVRAQDRLSYEAYLGHKGIRYHNVDVSKETDHLYASINSLHDQALKRNKPYQALGLHSLFQLNQLLIEETPPKESWFVCAGEGFKEATQVFARLFTPMSFIHAVLELKDEETTMFEGLILREQAMTAWPISIHHTTTSWYGKTPLKTDVMPCIECGRCVKHCPVNLFPQKIHKALTLGQNVARLSPTACIGCGLCSFYCPSRIPLRESAVEAAAWGRRYG